MRGVLIFKRAIASVLVVSILTLSVGCARNNVDMRHSQTGRDVTVIIDDNEREGDVAIKKAWAGVLSIVGLLVLMGGLALIANNVPDENEDSRK